MLFISLSSTVWGAIGAINQKKIKRFIAYSSINQLGLIFFGVSCGNYFGLFASISFLIIYLITTLGIFITILFTEQLFLNKNLTYLSELNGFWLIDKTLCLIFSIFFLSLAGFPPFLGFWFKNLY